MQPLNPASYPKFLKTAFINYKTSTWLFRNSVNNLYFSEEPSGSETSKESTHPTPRPVQHVAIPIDPT
jgi:hypothetical protein